MAPLTHPSYLVRTRLKTRPCPRRWSDFSFLWPDIHTWTQHLLYGGPGRPLLSNPQKSSVFSSSSLLSRAAAGCSNIYVYWFVLMTVRTRGEAFIFGFSHLSPTVFTLHSSLELLYLSGKRQKRKNKSEKKKIREEKIWEKKVLLPQFGFFDEPPSVTSRGLKLQTDQCVLIHCRRLVSVDWSL